MKLSRFFVAGVLVPVMLGANESKAEGCTGRFYVGVNVGAEFGKMKYSQKPGDQYDVVPDGLKSREIDTPPAYEGEAAEAIKNGNVHVLTLEPKNVQLSSNAKRKCRITGDVEVGYVLELKNFGIGLAINFGKSFGTVKKSTPSRMVKYTNTDEVGMMMPLLMIQESERVEGAHPETETTRGLSNHRFIPTQKYETAIKYNTKDATEIKLKNKYNVTITPILEYKANSMFGIYITGGIRISNDKVTYKETDGATKKVTDCKKTKTSIAPVVGGGILVNLSEHMYAKVQYLYQFGSKIKKTISRKINDKKNEVTPTVKYRSQKVTVGFGYMF